jgi:uroporphyrinogen-III decarboxylase
MPDYSDLISLVRHPGPSRVLPCFYDFAPCHAAAAGGIPDLMRYYFDVDEKLECQLRLKALLPEALVFPGVFADFGVIAEVSAFGGQMLWFENGAPFIHPCLGALADIDALKLPKPGYSGLTAAVIAQQAAMQARLRGRGLSLEPFALSMGPAEISGLLMGYDRFYMGLYDDPKRIKTLLALVTEFVIAWLKKQGEAFGGAEILMVADHVCHQVRPQQLNEFILPFVSAVFAEFPDAVKVYHNEGLHSPAHIETVLRFGADVWHFGSDVHPLPELLDRVGERLVLFGGLNPHGVIRTGSPQEVFAEARAAAAAAKGRRLILSSGTGTTPDAPLENVRALVAGAMA